MKTLAVVSGCLLCMAVLVSAAEARTWVVAGDGSGDFVLVSEAYAAAASGDSILIMPGHYQEAEHDDEQDMPIMVNGRSLTTVGAGMEPRDVSLTLMLSFRDCQETVLENLWFHDTGNPLLLGGTGGARIVECAIEDNTCQFGNAAVVLNNNGPTTVEDCVFSRNTVYGIGGFGGAIYFDSPGGSLILRRSLFRGNEAEQAGGAVCTRLETTIEDCVFLGNHAPSGGAVYFTYMAPCVIRNCTFWGNEGSAAVHIEEAASTSIIEACIFSHSSTGGGVSCGGPFSGIRCCLEWDNAYINTDCIASGQDGNFTADPLLCDPELGDVSLREGSPCLPGMHGGVSCGLIGAGDLGCSASPVQVMSWGKLKASYRGATR